MIGELLDGKYQILRLLGRGGMGSVYEAVHTGTHRKVAVKVITEALASGAEGIDRFQREARIVGTIDTQHIVQVLDSGTVPETGAPYMVMELLVGEDLQRLIKRLGPLPPDLALRIGGQVCLGLQKAHEAGVVHRDIKPGNLFLHRRDGEVIVKLLDFGIAKVQPVDMSPEAQALTQTGALLGSPAYMAPEQAKGSKTVDGRADLWSLGVVLYKALTGRTPHQQIDNVGHLIFAICAEPAPLLQDFAPWVSPQLATIVHTALQIDPDARFPDALTMYNAIRAELPQGHGVYEQMLSAMPFEERARVAPRLELSTMSLQITTGGTVERRKVANGGLSTTGPLPPLPRSSLAPALVLGAAVVAGVTGGGYLFYRRSSPPASHTQPSASAATAATTAAAADTAPASRVVRLGIAPAGAHVTIDGASADLVDGYVQVHGQPGTRHSVRVASDGHETAADVVVTDDGAFPARVELGAAPSAGSAAAPPSGSGAPQVSAPHGSSGGGRLPPVRLADAPSAKPATPPVAPVPPPVAPPTAAKPAVPALDKSFQ
jgi:serine/threonine-protein kinase